jgi:putative secretion ATPase (PEP-CTERM system associated)
MYEAHYGLTRKPFQLSPDASFYYAGKPHRRARAYMEYGVARGEGFIVITGEVGAGKTTVLTHLIETLDPATIVVGRVSSTQLDPHELLRMVGGAFGFPVQGRTKSELLISLETFLLRCVAQRRRCLLVVDEAQNLSPAALEELRMLSNFQIQDQTLLQSYLVGQPEFRALLQRPQMEQFRQRVVAACHIDALDAEDTVGYVQHRLRTAGAEAAWMFDDDALAAVHEATRGLPRRINLLCDRVLLHGYLEGRRQLTAQDVREVDRELREEPAFGLRVPEGAPLAPLHSIALPAEPAHPAAAAGLPELAPLADTLARMERRQEALQRSIDALRDQLRVQALTRA